MVIGSTGSSQNITQQDSIFTNNSSNTTESFVQELVSALENDFAKSGGASGFNISVQSGATPGQFTISVNPTAAAAAATPTSEATTPAGTTPADTSSGGNSTASAGESPTDAYWASQPAAVQALRYAPDGQKGAMAEQLASEGYSVDVPIMVWGWDPLATMIQRQSEGYTWVPSAMQPSVQDAPGISMPGTTPYDPSNPPAGSIAVSTAFANGTNIASDPIAEEWLKGQAASAVS